MINMVTAAVFITLGVVIILVWIDNRRDLQVARELHAELTAILDLDDPEEADRRMRAVSERVEAYLARPIILPGIRERK